MKQKGYSATTKACHWIIPEAAAKAWMNPRADPGDRKEPADGEGHPREEQEAAVAVERAEERIHRAARDVDALEHQQRVLQHLREVVRAVARERLAEARRRREHEELRALELADERGDHVEVELAVAQHVAGGQIL